MKRLTRALLLIGLVANCSCGPPGPPPPRVGDQPTQPNQDVTVPAKEPVTGEDPEANVSDWPWWRGPQQDGQGVGPAPSSWSTSENVLWKSPVPGKGFASPVICGDHVYVATADEAAEEQLLVCYNRATGKQLWRNVVHSGNFTPINPANSHASATPTCDGENVYVAFINGESLWVTAYDDSGKQLWQREAGPFESEHGYGSSPVLYKSAIIVAGDNLDASYIAALDRRTGKLIWRTPRERLDIHGSYATPVVAKLADRDQLVLAGYSKVTSYDPTTGELIWYCQGPCQVAACTAAVNDDLVFASGGFPEKELMAIRADGTGDVTDTHVAWRTNKGVTYVPSPLYYDGYLYVVTDNGIAYCYDAASGAVQWQERLPGKYSASPVVADGKLFVTSEQGHVSVLKAAPSYQLLAENDMASDGHATPAICGGNLYIRTADALYCIGVDTRQASR